MCSSSRMAQAKSMRAIGWRRGVVQTTIRLMTLRAHFPTLRLFSFNFSKPHILSAYSYQDKFVRFTGSIRTFQNHRHINAQIIRILEDQNEAYFHFNEVMAVTLYHRHGTVRAHILIVRFFMTNTCVVASQKNAKVAVQQRTPRHRYPTTTSPQLAI